MFVAVGDDGTVMTSVNGTEWVPRNSGSTGELFNVVYGGGQFVAVGRLETGSGYAGVILTSADGADWRPQDSGIRDPLYAVAYGAGMFVAVGHLSAVASADGLTWHRVPVPNYAPVYAIAYGNGRFVTAENDVYTPRQAFSVSEDANYWRSTTADTEGTAWAVTFGSGIFAAVGGLNLNFANPTNQFVVSTDGQHWTTYPLGLVPELHGIAYGAGAFVAVGLSGAIVQSGVVTQSQLTLLRTSDEPFVQITLQGDEGVYRLQTSTNLATGLWSDVLLLTNATGTVTVTNVPAPPVAQQFYRAVNQ